MQTVLTVNVAEQTHTWPSTIHKYVLHRQLLKRCPFYDPGHMMANQKKKARGKFLSLAMSGQGIWRYATQSNVMDVLPKVLTLFAYSPVFPRKLLHTIRIFLHVVPQGKLLQSAIVPTTSSDDAELLRLPQQLETKSPISTYKTLQCS